MHSKTLFLKLFPSYLLISVISVVLVSLYAFNVLAESSYAQAEKDLLARTQSMQQQIAQVVQSKNDKAIQSAARSTAKLSGVRLTLISLDGKVFADSQADISKMENHSDRPEFREAIVNEIGQARRRSPTLGITMVYVALPIKAHGETVAVLRTALSAKKIEAGPAFAIHRIAFGTLLIALLAGIAGLIAARRISAPLIHMQRAAAQLASGELHARVPVADTTEMADLANTLNKMAAQLDKQVRKITQQSSEQQAILASMQEGVIAVGSDDRIIILNPAAEALLGVTAESTKNKTIQEALRHSDLQRLFANSDTTTGQVAEEITLRAQGNKLLQATVTPLLDTAGAKIGVLIVLNDITQTRKLENIRKDFVANVSHELRTPITSIKGFLETIRETSLTDPEKSAEFLDIAVRQTDRLNAIIEDLLTLSRIERWEESAEINLEISPLCPVINSTATNCQALADSNGIKVKIECDETLSAQINAPLLEQAITNLLDNAIQYSPANGEIRITAQGSDGEIVISVADDGLGIEQEHLSRIFERFYRVDKARSRKLGGTGLGLAIAKHIIQAHGGTITVESILGKGSTFSIHLPKISRFAEK